LFAYVGQGDTIAQWIATLPSDQMRLATGRRPASPSNVVIDGIRSHTARRGQEMRHRAMDGEPTRSDTKVLWTAVSTGVQSVCAVGGERTGMENDFGRVIDALPGLVWTALADGRVDFVNKRWCEYTGVSLGSACGREWLTAVHPDDRSRLLDGWASLTQAGEPGELEGRLGRFDGEHRWFLFRVSPITDASGAIVKWCGVNTDIEDRKWVETLLAGEKRLLEMVARGSSLPDVLNALCWLVEDAASGCLCSILSIDPDGVRFRHGAGPSLPTAYNELLDGLVMDRSYGPCGMAANLKTQVIASDVALDPRWRASPWPNLVLGHGLRSCWSTPILSRDDKVIGVFALYKREAGGPNPRELDLIRQFAHIASIAIEHVQSDVSLKQSEARKAAILDSALDCIVTIDHQGRITDFNPAAERTFGYRHDEVMGRLLANVIIPPALRDRHRLGLARYLATGETQMMGRRIEMTAIRADGGEFPAELTIARTLIDGPPSFTGYLRDISERKRAEEELRRSNAHLAEAQRLSLTGSFTWNVSTDEHYWSDEVYRIFEYDRSKEISLQSVLKNIHPEDAGLIDQVMTEVAEQRDFKIEFRAVTPSGAVKHVLVVSHRVREQDDHLEYIGAIRDVTERRLADEALSKVRSELTHMARVTSLGALTASIAHEVNQPLSGIITNANTCLKMLAAEPPNVVGAQETARRTVRDGNRAADIIKRLRSLFAKTEATSEPVDLNEAARDVIALSWSDLQRARVIVRPEFAADLPLVTGDRVQLQQVILNLLLNAADAMSGVTDRPRQALIRTALDGDDQVRLTVEDTGVGLDPQAAKKLFEAFYTTKPDGMGIGLSVSRSIIENHGGRLRAEPNDGSGASFSFSVPRHSEDAPEAGSLQAIGQSAAGEPRPAMVKR
jgi:PAS domain S-box-containing protein